MKKILTLFIVFSLALSMFACSEDKEESKDNERKEASTSESQSGAGKEESTNDESDNEENENSNTSDEDNSGIPENKDSNVTEQMKRAARFYSVDTDGSAWVYGRMDSKYYHITFDGKVLGTTSDWAPTSKTLNGYTTAVDSNDDDNIYTQAIIDKNGNVLVSEKEAEASFIMSHSLLENNYNNYNNYNYHILKTQRILAYTYEESYDSVVFKMGVLDLNGNWIVPLSDNHPLIQAGLTYDRLYSIYSADSLNTEAHWYYFNQIYYNILTNETTNTEPAYIPNEEYINDLTVEVIENPAGTLFIGVKDRGGNYVTEPFESPIQDDDPDIQFDGTYILISTPSYIQGHISSYLYDTNGTYLSCYSDYMEYAILSNGIIYSEYRYYLPSEEPVD